MRNKIKAIPTKYSDVTFRSKMEANFAKWCDHNKQKWIYEPEGLTNGNEVYLPDFFLPDSKMIIEIKPVFFIKEAYKLDMIMACEEFDKFGLAVIEMNNGCMNVIKYAAPEDQACIEEGERCRGWEDKEQFHNIGFCYKCGAFNINGFGSWECTGCGYYDGDNTISNEYGR